MAALPEITPFPTPIILKDLVERQQQVTTISVVASSTPSGVDTGSNTTEKKGFPVAVAIPALVGGMAAAFGAFGLWWWCTKRGKRQRRERWEAAQRKKQRARANSSGRPSISSSRQPSATNLKNMAGGEKEIIPPVPALPKHYPPAGHAREKQQQSYGYQPQPHPQGQGQYDQTYAQHPYQHQYQPPASGAAAQYAQYGTQPTIDGPISPTYSDHSSGSGSASGSGSGTAETPIEKPKKTSPTKTGSRSTARVAVADSAAATAGLDANVRYQPKKPSPLALKAQQEKDALNARNAAAGGAYRYDDQPEEVLQSQSQTQYLSAGKGVGRNVVSGEWGVALGSPNHDPSFSFADQQSIPQGGQNTSRYSNDPYLSASTQRAPSGQYANDPYAGYHDPVVNNGKKSNWV